MKTAELVGPALDWAVAKCEALVLGADIFGLRRIMVSPEFVQEYCPSTSWEQGGPIIERERINVRDEVTQWSSWMWDATRCGDVSYYGPTPLIAAMRCYVASKLGDEIEIPEELK